MALVTLPLLCSSSCSSFASRTYSCWTLIWCPVPFPSFTLVPRYSDSTPHYINTQQLYVLSLSCITTNATNVVRRTTIRTSARAYVRNGARALGHGGGRRGLFLVTLVTISTSLTLKTPIHTSFSSFATVSSPSHFGSKNQG